MRDRNLSDPQINDMYINCCRGEQSDDTLKDRFLEVCGRKSCDSRSEEYIDGLLNQINSDSMKELLETKRANGKSGLDLALQSNNHIIIKKVLDWVIIDYEKSTDITLLGLVFPYVGALGNEEIVKQLLDDKTEAQRATLLIRETCKPKKTIMEVAVSRCIQGYCDHEVVVTIFKYVAKCPYLLEIFATKKGKGPFASVNEEFWDVILSNKLERISDIEQRLDWLKEQKALAENEQNEDADHVGPELYNCGQNENEVELNSCSKHQRTSEVELQLGRLQEQNGGQAGTEIMYSHCADGSKVELNGLKHDANIVIQDENNPKYPLSSEIFECETEIRIALDSLLMLLSQRNRLGKSAFDYEAFLPKHSRLLDLHEKYLFRKDSPLSQCFPEIAFNEAFSYSTTGKMHPLSVIGGTGYLELSQHPYIQAYIYIIWKAFVRYVFYTYLLLYCVLFFSLSAFVVTTFGNASHSHDPVKATAGNLSNVPDFAGNISHPVGNASDSPELVKASLGNFSNVDNASYTPQSDEDAFNFKEYFTISWSNLFRLVIIILSALGLMLELWQMAIFRQHYLTDGIKNYLDLFIFIGNLVVSIMSSEHRYNSDLHSVGLVLILASSIRVAWMMKHLPIIGDKFRLLLAVVYMVIRFLPVLLFFLLTFAVVFHGLLKHQKPFSNIGYAMVKVFIMSIGEYESEGILFQHEFDITSLEIVTCVVRDMGWATWGSSLPRVETTQKIIFCEARCINFNIKLVYGEIKYLKVEKNDAFQHAHMLAKFA